MITNFKKILFLSFMLLMISCGKSEKEIKEEKQKAIEQKGTELETSNEKSIKDLAVKYKAVSGWDTSDIFTCRFQEMFIDSNKLINFEGRITDITKTDSTYILKIHYKTHRRHYIAEISVSNKKYSELRNIINSKNHSNEGCFIFRVSKIIAANPEIKSNGVDLYLDYDFNKILVIFKGDLIDYYINETVENPDK